jgi:lipopolysaccharide/colanic/teichoic acid biosynthesis glycosyltransferase
MRLLGRIAATFIALIGFPFHLVLCFCIRLADGQPALYRSLRLGRLGVPFEMLKYRTMKVGCDAVVRPDFRIVVSERDARVTAVGRVLRCGIDECAQIGNVLRGEMAWIGPRPDEAWMLGNYGPVIRERLQSVPGITGLAQVLNCRECSTARAYAIDIWYIHNRSVLLDLWIVAVTPLFIAGWRSVGRRRLDALVNLPEFLELENQCANELGSA